MKNLKIALQRSGRLSDKSIQLLRDSGFEIEANGRELIGKCTNFPLEILFVRAKNIPELISDGVADLGICGQDTVVERSLSGIEEIEKLGFGKCRLSIAGKKKTDLAGKRIATSYPKILNSYLQEEQIKAEIVEFEGSVEIAPSIEVSDLICDLVSTGSTLKMNGLKEFQTIFESQAVLIGREVNTIDPLILEKFLERLRAKLRSRNTKYIVMNTPKTSLLKIQELVPGMESPTVSFLADPEWVSISSVVAEDVFWETITRLKSYGTKDILVMPIEKVIL